MGRTHRLGHRAGEHVLTELAALRAALPGYAVTVTSHSPAYRFKAIHRGVGPALAASSAATPPTFGGDWPGVPGRPPWTAIPFDRASAGAPVGALAVPASASFLVTGTPVPSMTA